MKHLKLERQTTLRWGCALLWTTLTLVALLQSSGKPVLGPPAPPGPPSPEREFLLTLGHVVVFTGLTALWWWAFSVHLPGHTALMMAVFLALCLGISTEIAQTAIPDRSASWADLSVNFLATAVTAWQIQRRTSRAVPPE